MAELMMGHVMANGQRIHYYRTGGEKEPVVLLHGLSDYGLCWGRLPLFLEPIYDVVMVDLRGHGLSDKPEDGYRAEIMAQDVAETIRALNLIKPVVVGHSLGAVIAAALAAQSPDLVSGVVLEDPPWHTEAGGMAEKEKNAQGYLAWINGLKTQSLQGMMDFARKENPSWDESEFMQWAKGKLLVSLHTARYIHEEQIPWQQMIKGIKVPGLLVYADVDRGAIVSQQVAEAAQSLWPRLEIAYLPGAGHSIHREQYFKYRDVVKQFLRKHL
ncbi:MAG: alpha/beta hydrolase [Chloroflexi bacterium HGW-Chloroflexi-10]|nr:MAG: alpha/beta hydrolase [Chloroflexi bacterium HGW-Chloroflexi-10]